MRRMFLLTNRPPCKVWLQRVSTLVWSKNTVSESWVVDFTSLHSGKEEETTSGLSSKTDTKLLHNYTPGTVRATSTHPWECLIQYGWVVPFTPSPCRPPCDGIECSGLSRTLLTCDCPNPIIPVQGRKSHTVIHPPMALTPVPNQVDRPHQYTWKPTHHSQR